MASSAIFFSFFLGLSLHVSADKPSDICPVRVCHPHGPEIRFPFRVRDFHPERCGYPGFDLSCNIRGQAILQLPNLQYFVVDLINYEQQYVVLKEPTNCLAKRLQNLTLSRSPFLAEEYGSYTFASCIEDLSSEPGIERVDCVSDQRNNVLYSSTSNFYASWYFSVFKCRNWTVSVPVSSQYPTNITERVVLRWDLSDCGGCEKSGGRCGLKVSAGSDVRCFGKHGFLQHAKFWILSGVILPFVACMSCIACYLSSHSPLSSHRGRRGHPPNIEDGENNVVDISFPSSPSRETRSAPNGVAGIDLATIESYPKIQVDDDGQVPRPNDDTCAICLSEYQPKETLRTIPACGHYFHAQCIDQWLRRNASCPLCRDHKGSPDPMTASN
ncbi:putative RING-H2 finger protein ATL21A [Rhodamnia argentea]|uniref:RING-type E3 ubiquitin transferase n=1 Tax=Rhodamnia argentea TaxID=178133 RepID=A0A8B8QRL5_9MYRT|nr:putative RING-H2 finger protein ATL21A [Rhodamnia argentea]